MNPFLLTILCFTLVGVLHHFLKIPFWVIEKAHEYLRESERRNAGAELVKGSDG